jgi:hypothetical protein
VADYRTVIEPIPNMAIDVLVPALLQFTAIVQSSKIFLAIPVLLFVIGCHYLIKAVHGQPT